MIVKPATLTSWHRTAFGRFWRLKSRPAGRPQISSEVVRLIRRMAAENITWGEERIADELLLKLHIHLSPRTVAKYLKRHPYPRRSKDQRWASFIRNHASGIVACDFFVSITASFRIFYVLVALEVGSRRILHFNLTEHPTAEWTLQQLREALPSDHPCKFLLHDRHKSFSENLDVRSPKLGHPDTAITRSCADCERLLRTIDRNDPSRVFGLCHSAKCGSPAPYPS